MTAREAPSSREHAAHGERAARGSGRHRCGHVDARGVQRRQYCTMLAGGGGGDWLADAGSFVRRIALLQYSCSEGGRGV